MREKSQEEARRLPEPGVLILEIADNIRSAMQQCAAIAFELRGE